MHSQVVSTAFVTMVVFYVAAGAPFTQETLGRRAAKLSSVTKLIYIFFAIGSMCFLPASGLLSPPCAPARRAHPATSRLGLSPLSPGAAHRRGGRRVLKAGALKHLLAEGHLAVPAALLGQKNRRLRRAKSSRGGRCMALLALSGGFSKVVLGVLL